MKISKGLLHDFRTAVLGILLVYILHIVLWIILVETGEIIREGGGIVVIF